jgi:hypothetical protein
MEDQQQLGLGGGGKEFVTVGQLGGRRYVYIYVCMREREIYIIRIEGDQ